MTSNLPASARRLQREPLIKRIARVLMPLVVTTTTIQPLAYAAPNPSLLAQQPRFVDVAVDSNVAFIMDDSLSTEDIRLPVPANLNPGESTGGAVAIRGAATGYASGAWTVGSALSNIDRNNEWIYRSSTLNPLYYNPAITYKPWNDNGRAGAAGNFTNALVGTEAEITAGRTDDFRFGLTPHDMRYVGPNYYYGNGNNFNRRLPAGNGINAGANPPPVPSYLTATRTPNGGFQGVTDGAATPRSQDLFTSPMVLADGGAPQCTVTPSPPTSSALPTIVRGSTAQPSTPLGTTTRPSSSISTQARDTVSRGVYDRPLQDRPTAAPTNNITATTTTRTTSPLTTSPMGQARPVTAATGDSNRTPATRPSTLLTSDSNRTPVDRVSTALAAPTDRTLVTTLATEYRQEQGTCGTWSGWSTTPPTPKFCSDPNSEGGVRVALIETRQQTCPTDSSPNPNNSGQCLSNCPAGTTTSGTQCVYSCGSGTTLIGSRCYSACGGTTPNYWGNSNNAATSTQCIASCPSSTVASGTQCLGVCGAGESLIGGRCYSVCGGTTPNYWGGSNNAATSTQCIASCPSGTTPSDTQCLGGGCPSTHPTLISSQCYANCTGTYNLYGTGGISTATQCRRSCAAPGVVNTTTDVCETCPSGTRGTGTTIGSFTSNANLCYSTTCPTGTPIPGNLFQCQSCPSGTLLPGTGPTAGQCLTCPATFNTLTSGARANDGVCYGACPTATPAWAFWNGVNAPTSTNSWQCRQGCPTGTGTNSSGTNTVRGQCFPACAANYEALLTTATVCHRDCVNQLGSGFEVNPSNNTQCRSTCNSPNLLVGSLCYTDCSSGAPFGSPATLCAGSCPSGSTLSGTQCLGQCPSGNANPALNFPTLSGSTCYADCPATHPTVNPSNVAQCQGPCASGTQSGTQCLACATGSTLLPSGQCCPSTAVAGGNCPAKNNTGSATGCVAGNYYRDYDRLAPARYFIFEPATAISNPTPAQLVDPGNYVLVEINRDKPNTPRNFPKAGTRTDCTGSVCTWDEEAQNFANWFTYYRTRLFSAVAVTSESLSNLTRLSNLDGLRLAYGSINYFPNGADPFNSGGRLPSTISIDGKTSNGALVRGVRPFTEVSPPPAPGSDDRRQEAFDWLFSLRAIASTPNREALDSVGRYFSRTDPRGPWIQPNGALPPDPSTGVTPPAVAGRWSSNEDPADHITCRRNYTIMITDGEWTRAPWVPAAPQQLLVEEDPPDGTAKTQLNALSQTGPTITGPGSRTYTYNPATQIQFSTNASNAGGTLSDIAFYYWSRDLRTDLVNGIRVVDRSPGSQGNPAFWQHMVPYLIGYGISATLDTDETRAKIVASAATPQTIDWPSVRLESRPAEDPYTIVTDRDAAPINCGYNPASQPAGCGRVDDTMRAAFAARGNFLSAADVGRLSQGVAAAFTAIGEIEGSATSLTGRSGTLQTGERLFAASFRTNIWTGRVQSFDAVAYFQGLATSTTPASVDSRFPAAASRTILTSSANGTAVAFPTGASDFNNLSSAQRTLLNNDATLAQWVRGDQSREARNGGPFRNRPVGEIMGSIVNSQPFFSKAPDFGYQSARKPAADGSTGNAYRTYVNDNKNYRPARIYVGSNSGMLHAFDVTGTPATNSNYMNEVFAYVPRAVYGSLEALASPGYVHRYLVDGPIVEGDVYTSSAWRTVIVGTTGAGPKGIFALDVTQRSGSTATTVGTGNVLWDLASTDSVTNIEHVGNILQPGVIGSGKDGEWYYFVGNGYESQNDLAKLLAIRVRDGAIFAIDTDSAGGNNPAAANVDQRPNGLGGVTPVYDPNRNIIAIYAGDRLGRLWKFDLSSTNRSAWSSTRLFTATDPSGNRQPITAAPRVLPHPLGGRMVVAGTGRIFERTDLSDLSIQTVYGVWEKNTASPTAVAKNALREFTLADQVESTTNTRFRQLTGTTSLNWGTDLGWYFNLTIDPINSATGERVVASPTENFGFVNVTSFEPSTDGDPCKGGGRSFFYRLDVAGSFTRAPFAPTGPITNLPNTVAPNTVVGSELPEATVNQLQTLLRPATGTSNTSSTLSSTDMGTIANQNASAATNPCLGSQAGGQSLTGTAVSSPTLSCPVAPLRTWREMPRGPR